jgi:hypothetical protein
MTKSKMMFLLMMLCLPNFALGQEADSTASDTIKTESTTQSTINSTSDSTTTVKTAPPSAISPQINTANSDLCTVGIAGAVQTQILGISAGKTVRDMNCEKLKNAKIGVEAKAAWEENQDQMPGNKNKVVNEETKSTLIGGGILGTLLLLLLL